MGVFVVSAEYMRTGCNRGMQDGYCMGYLSEGKYSDGVYFSGGALSGIPQWRGHIKQALTFSSAEDALARIKRDLPYFVRCGCDIKSGSLMISEVEERYNNGCGPCVYSCPCKTLSGYCAAAVCIHPEHRFIRFVVNNVAIDDCALNQLQEG